MFAGFVAWRLADRPLPCPPADGLTNVAVIAAIHKAAETTAPVEVKT